MGDKNKEKMDTARLEQSLRRREKAVKLPAKYKDLSPTSVKAELKTLREEVSAAAAKAPYKRGLFLRYSGFAIGITSDISYFRSLFFFTNILRPSTDPKHTSQMNEVSSPPCFISRELGPRVLQHPSIIHSVMSILLGYCRSYDTAGRFHVLSLDCHSRRNNLHLSLLLQVREVLKV